MCEKIYVYICESLWDMSLGVFLGFVCTYLSVCGGCGCVFLCMYVSICVCLWVCVCLSMCVCMCMFVFESCSILCVCVYGSG